MPQKGRLRPRCAAILPFPVFAPLQVAVVELQRLDNEVRFLPSGDGLGDELGYPLVLEGGLFFLVGLKRQKDSPSYINSG